MRVTCLGQLTGSVVSCGGFRSFLVAKHVCSKLRYCSKLGLILWIFGLRVLVIQLHFVFILDSYYLRFHSYHSGKPYTPCVLYESIRISLCSHKLLLSKRFDKNNLCANNEGYRYKVDNRDIRPWI